MKLWTFQHINFYNQLQETGVAYIPVVGYWAKECPWAYEWIVAQMKERIGDPPLPEIFTPVWAWYQYDSKKKARPPYSPKDVDAPEKQSWSCLPLKIH